MTAPSFPITTITPASIQQTLTSDKLDTLGLTTLALSTRWADTTPVAGDYDGTALTLAIGALRAPWRGILDFAFSPVSSTLAADLAKTDTTLTVQAGDGDKFPSPSVGSMPLVLTNAGGTAMEIVDCTARNGDSFTIGRAANNTTAEAFKTGDKVALRLTDGTRTSSFIGADGNPLTGTCAAFRMHPAAILRLETLMKHRYVTGANPLILPVPWCMVVRDAQGFTTARWFEPDESVTGVAGKISFHDGRGLIVDPLYVAALFADLQTWLTGLTGKTSKGDSATGDGGVGSIATKLQSAATLVHCVDLHGNVYQPALAAATLVTEDGSNNQTPIPQSGLVTLNAGDGITASTNDAARLRWGWATNGVLDRTKLVPPALPTGQNAPSLPRQFYRVAVVDTVWALLGNRTASTVLGIPADDQTIAADVQPKVRDNVVIDYLVDGPDTLATASAVLARTPQNMILAVSPVIDGGMTVPTQAGANAHWPGFPAPNTNTAFLSPPASPKDGLQAAWATGNDVVVTIAPNKAPNGAHVRIYPRQFVTIAAIAEQPSFIRGDGAAAIAQDNQATAILLRNPFGLTGSQPRPNNLTMDIVVMPRQGTRKLWGNASVQVAAGPAPVPPDPFAGTNGVTNIPATFESVAPDPLFSIPNTITPPGTAPSTLVQFVRALASEDSPRQGPRCPTMARFDTVVVTGLTQPNDHRLLWEAVLTGGRWARETRSALHASGNPGNPGAPDVHAPGIHVTGALAYDLARHAMRRAQPIIPMPTTPRVSLGWFVGMDGDNFNEPKDRTTTNTGIGVMLETVAAACETPELMLFNPPAQGTNAQQVMNAIASAIGVNAPGFQLGNDTRIIGEVRRECFVSASGLRDAMWSLRRALREARELIYIESAQFARTARPTGQPTAEQVDLVGEIVTSLSNHPNLRVIICTPRESDFAANYPGWSREHYKARTEAVSNLLAAAPDRIVAFHPVGFPERTAFIRTTSIIVDDVWCLSGATHFRRRGMTFDGSVAIASFDRQMDNGGYSRKVRAYRRGLMAAKMAIVAPGARPASADWMRLAHPQSAFALVTDWLAQGGLGLIQPLWPGPSDTTVVSATDDMADPDGSNGATFLGLFASLIAEAGS